jgi:hypothetical protein
MLSFCISARIAPTSIAWTLCLGDMALSLAGSYSFSLFASLKFDGAERPVRYVDREYTFAWLAMVRT